MSFWKNSKRTRKDEEGMQPGQRTATGSQEAPGQPEKAGNQEGSGQPEITGGLEARKHPVAPGWLWGVLAGLLFLGIGTIQGQLAVVWRKAVMICLECIGIG